MQQIDLVVFHRFPVIGFAAASLFEAWTLSGL